MKYTLRALLAVGLLAAVALLGLVTLGWFVLLGYLRFDLQISVLTLLLPALVGAVGSYVVLTVVRASTRVARRTPLGLELPEPAQPIVWREARRLAAAVGTRPPDEIRLVADARTTLIEVPHLLGLRPGLRRLEIGVPLLLALTNSQLLAAITVELGRHRTARLGAATVWRATDAVRRVGAELGTETPVARLFAALTGLFLRVAAPVDQRQLLEADTAAAGIAGRNVTVSTLHELVPVAEDWEAFLSRYVGPSHRIGLRPRAIAEGFLDLREDPARRSLLAVGLDDSDTLARVDVIESLPSDALVDDGLPGFAVLTDPDHTMAAFFATLYGVESDLAPAEWDQILVDVARHHVEEQAGKIVHAVRSAPWRGGREASLDAVSDELRLGRGMELARRVSDARTASEQQALAATLVGSLVAVLLLERNLATIRRGWSGADVLLDTKGAVIDLARIGGRAVASADGVVELLAYVGGHGIPTSEILDLGAQEGPGPLRVLGCIAPLQSGVSTIILMPCNTGLAVLRPRGLAEWVAVSQSPVASGTARKLHGLLMTHSPEELVRRPGTHLLAWDDIAGARLAERSMRRPLLTLTLESGERRKFKVLRQTDGYGDPWDPWDALRHFLDDRFTEHAVHGSPRRAESRVRVPEA